MSKRSRAQAIKSYLEQTQSILQLRGFNEEERQFCNWQTSANVGPLSDQAWLHGVALACASYSHRRSTFSWLKQVAPSGVSAVLRVAGTIAEKLDPAPTELSAFAAIEDILAAEQPRHRRARGVYFTPLQVAAWIIRNTDRELCDQCDNPLGLCDPQLRILDPAVGSGVFLVELIRHIHRRWCQESGLAEAQGGDWSRYVAEQLLPRLIGYEILAPTVIAAHLQLAGTLAETGFDFRTAALHIQLRDALQHPANELPAQVVIGNPPYGSLSQARFGWIESLITADYAHVDGQPLDERKHWLHDDYVKFIRLAQWHIQQSGWGVVGLVTNHGYLENTSFRGLRCSLLNTFSRIRLLDLKGDVDSIAVHSAGADRDESVFNIAAGTAIGIFCQPPAATMKPRIELRHLLGSTAFKLAQLDADELDFKQIVPAAPRFRFAVPRRDNSLRYESGWRLCDAMPYHFAVPVTARDHFVVSFSYAELNERIENFCDTAISDAKIRAEYFNRTRSNRYPPGDSRSWKLAASREAMRQIDWRQAIRLCQYRALDYRWIVWHPAMIDWPRSQGIAQMAIPGNLALIARRQSPESRAANYFWSTKHIAIDGVLRSDNRGSESLFPIFVEGNEGISQPNFAPDFIQALEKQTSLVFDADVTTGASSLSRSFNSHDLAGYIYSLFLDSTYRSENHSGLVSDFPRIMFPRDADEFVRNSSRGSKLLSLHTESPNWATTTEFGVPLVSSLRPAWRDGEISVHPDLPTLYADESTWNFQVGAHRPCRKYLQDRKNRGINSLECQFYARLVERVRESTSLSDKCLASSQVDETLSRFSALSNETPCRQ